MVAERKGAVKAEDGRGSSTPRAAADGIEAAGGAAGGAVTELVAELAAVGDLELTPGGSLAPWTTFKLGGPAELLAVAHSEAALAALLAAVRRRAVPFHLFGLGSNVLVPDAGLPGVCTRLGRDFKTIEIDREEVVAGAAVALPSLARHTARRGLTGLEPLCGFPSTVGGAVWMNAGCYGTEIKDLLRCAWLVGRDGERRRIGVEELGAGYRSTALQGSGWIVTRASFRLAAGDPAAAQARIEEYNDKRWASLPTGVGNAGSIFKNPEGDAAGRLIDQCGLKGKASGGAEISAKHANVIVNRDGASAGDVLALMLAARAAVAERFGVTLEPEVILTGELAQRWRQAG